MSWKLVSLVILGAATAIYSEAQQGFAVPPPSLVERLRRQHHRGDWLRISTDSTRFEVRVREIGAQSLSGLSSRRSSAAIPESIPWSAVARLDRVRSTFRIGQAVGFAAGGPIGLAVAIGTGSSTSRGLVLIALGAAGGAWMGGRLGGLRVRERTLYVASPVSDSAALAREPTSGPLVSSGSPAPTLAGSAAPGGPVRLDSIRIERALRRLRPNQYLRIRGEFGEFEGFVAQVGRGGLEGLRPSRSEDWKSPWPRELGWDRIGRIERHGNGAGHGAFMGATVLVVPGLIVGMAAGAAVGAAGPGSGNAEVLGGGLLGAVIAGSTGAVLGGLIGCAIPRWHVVYGRP